MTLVVHFRDKFLCFWFCGASCFKNEFSSQCQKEPVSYANQYSRIFRYIGWPESPETEYFAVSLDFLKM